MKIIEELIPLTALAFALSMISERLSNLLKLYIPGWIHFFRQFFQFSGIVFLKKSLYSFIEGYIKPLAFIINRYDRIFQFKKSVFIWENLNIKQSDPELENIRERIIQLLSLLSGFLIAYLFQEDIQGVLKSFSKNQEKGLNIGALAGFSLLFSFGSKFWHDMLDLLLFTKNVKRKWGELNPAEIESADEFATRLQTSDRELVKKAIAQNEVWLRRDYKDIRTIVPGYEPLGGSFQHCAVIYLTGKKPDNFPASLPLAESSIKIPIKVIADLGPIVAQGKPGDQIAIDNYFGSFGCLVQSLDNFSDYYILTCAHVLSGRRKNYPKSLFNKTFEVEPDAELTLQEGHFRLGSGFDCALLGPVGKDNHSNLLAGNRRLSDSRTVSERDITERTIVYAEVIGGTHTGTIIDDQMKGEHTVQYEDGELLFKNLIMVKSNSPMYKFSTGGDSGSILYDNNGFALGLIIGGDTVYSYALPIDFVLLQLSSRIPK